MAQICQLYIPILHPLGSARNAKDLATIMMILCGLNSQSLRLASDAPICYHVRRRRAVAQFGSALPWGGRGRGFESRQSDHLYLRKDEGFFV